MAATAKNSSFFSNLVNNDSSQANQLGFATTSAYKESHSTASKDAPKTSSAQDLYGCPRDWGHKIFGFFEF
ncbi:hypothetical protein KIN20_033508 [Parelaphostrongylus tenuis]|uniref:Uncharacterized protein n=1 Tax=Parelaphostrongylus tenuis TaxID=148309 RepID=A0AAD5WIX8_PARTN|nr:hypothetical protein KIN20_033508 [Parelaphostrongylus tenuis]